VKYADAAGRIRELELQDGEVVCVQATICRRAGEGLGPVGRPPIWIPIDELVAKPATKSKQKAAA
jgi:hypothetical protein